MIQISDPRFAMPPSIVTIVPDLAAYRKDPLARVLGMLRHADLFRPPR